MNKLSELGERALISDRFKRVFVGICLIVVGVLFANIIVGLCH